MAKTVLSLLLVLLLSPPAHAGEGFRDIEWGENLSGREDFRVVRDGIESEYRRSPENLSAPGGQASDIAYRSWRNRFYEAEIVKITGNSDHVAVFDDARRVIASEYGPGECPPAVSDVRVCMWKGPETIIELFGSSEGASASFYSTVITGERNRERMGDTQGAR